MHLVGPALDEAEHPHGVLHVHGLVQGVVVHGHGGVGGHDPAAGVAGGDDFGLELGQPQHQVGGILVEQGGLIHLGRLQLEGDAHGLQPVAPPGAAAGQDEGLEGDLGEAGHGVGHRSPRAWRSAVFTRMWKLSTSWPGWKPKRG